MAVGSNRLLSNELVEAVKLILGEDVHVEPCLADSVDENTPGDLFVCNPTPLNHLMKVKPMDRILVLNLSPTSQFFVRIALIPRGEKVYIFNNKLEYTQRLAACCRKFGLDELDYIPIAYDEMPTMEVACLLQAAKYIIGVDKLVGTEVLLSDRFRHHIRPDTVIIGAKRVASIQSACALVQWVAMQAHEEIVERIRKIKADLYETTYTAGAGGCQHHFIAIADEIDQLMEQSSKSTETIRKAIMHSVTNQIVPSSFRAGEPVAEPAVHAQEDSPVGILYKTIGNIDALSEELQTIRGRLPL